jgi:hypothetical protein
MISEKERKEGEGGERKKGGNERVVNLFFLPPPKPK